MKNIKKIIISLIFIIIGILAINMPTVNAATKAQELPISSNKVNTSKLKVGEKYWIGFQQLKGYPNLFCIQHHQALNSDGRNYSLIAHIKLTNDEARKINNDGKTIKKYGVVTDDLNLELAAAIADLDTSETAYQNDLQYWIWANMENWVKKVGTKFGIPKNFATESEDGDYKDAEEQVDELVDDLEKSLDGISDKTKKSEINFKTINHDNKEYVRVGPFKWAGVPSKGVKDFKVNDQNNKAISGVQIVMYHSGADDTWIDVDSCNKNDKKIAIKNNTNFYICIPREKGITKITNITAKSTEYTSQAKADIYFFKSPDKAWQNLIVTKGSIKETPSDIKTEFTYNISMPGDLTIIKKDSIDNTPVKDAVFLIYRYVKDDKGSNKIEYIGMNDKGLILYSGISEEDAKQNASYQFKTNAQGKIELKSLKKGTYYAIEIKAPAGYKKITSVITLGEVKSAEKIEKQVNNEPQTGNIELTKVDKDNNAVVLSGVGFTFKHATRGWVVKSGSTISYTSDKNKATTFKTGSDGKITITGVVIGAYEAYEDPNTLPDGYIIEGNGTTKFTIKNGETTKTTIDNKQKYIKLSGIVWLDKEYVEKGENNKEAYDDYYNKGHDTLLDGITVRLKDKNGSIVKDKDKKDCITKTTNGGKYQFEGIDKDEMLKNSYYVEFEYNGMTYTNVTPHLTTIKEEKAEQSKTGTGHIGSKSAEGTNARDAFNNKFSVVEAGNTENTSITRDDKGNQTGTLTYNLENDTTAGIQKATLITNNEQQLIAAKTSEAGYKIEDYFVAGQAEITNINLGLKLREQPDMALAKDLDNVRVSINGYGHTYKYAQRFKNYGLDSETGFNVGVKYEERYNTDASYKRAIYKEDYTFENEDKSKELKVSMTYAIKLINQSSTLTTQINSIIDYSDSKYGNPISIGRTLKEDGSVVNDSSITTEKLGTYGETGYNKTLIKCNSKIEAGKADTIYVQFELNREAVINILNEKNNLNNVAEINSYSVFSKDGKVYAGVDKDSNPGSSNPIDKVTYQDDTDRAPELLLELADARKMVGTVFVDATSGELQVGQERTGNGKYDEGESGVPNVHIKLTENTGTGKVYETDTDENGSFEISSFIPGDYTLTYTWGDETYTVQNYKGTIYDKTRYDANTANKEWYKNDIDTRYTDATDNYETRKEIDKELYTIKHNTVIDTSKTMESTTPTMGIGVEYDTTTTDSAGDRYEYTIKNIDFGIVERPRQQVALTKRVKTIKLTLTNGTVISEAEIKMNDNGKYELTGEKSNMTWQGPSGQTEPENGFVKIELDSELMQGATLEVGYEFIVTNNSELDYNSESYYKYGIITGDVVTITPNTIIDYLDRDWGYEESKNQDWTQITTIEELEAKDLVDANVYNSENSNIASSRILYTEKLKDQKLEPEQTAKVELNVSKKIASSDDVELDNEAEVVEVSKTGGALLYKETPGNYIPGAGKTEPDDSQAETAIVTPNTGNNKAFIIPTIVGVTALLLLGTGVVLIKKKILTK